MSLRKIVSLVLPVARESSTCEACGGEFVCGAGLTGCWCTEVELTDEVRAVLRSRYRGCLCRACLERFASGADISTHGAGLGEEQSA